MAARSQELDGVTSVVLTSNDAPIEEIADDEEPADDERAGAFFRESEEP